jgi:pimeloyl-ACP methyl ester carboxylesterase
VAGLVYITAFAPEKGESVETLIRNPPAGGPVPPILPPQDGFLFLNPSRFAASFAADVDPELAAFMGDSQAPWGVEALSGKVSEPAWKSKPSWYLVSANDKMIPPDAQRAMAALAGSKVVEVKGSHAVYVSQPQATAELIEQAAAALSLAAKGIRSSGGGALPSAKRSIPRRGLARDDSGRTGRHSGVDFNLEVSIRA